MSELKTHTGGCHCGAVRWEVDLPDAFEVEDCNCSMCAMSGNIHIIVPSSRFRLTEGNDNLAEYTFNTGVAKHLFCKTCGVKSFYSPYCPAGDASLRRTSRNGGRIRGWSRG